MGGIPKQSGVERNVDGLERTLGRRFPSHFVCGDLRSHDEKVPLSDVAAIPTTTGDTVFDGERTRRTEYEVKLLPGRFGLVTSSYGADYNQEEPTPTVWLAAQGADRWFAGRDGDSCHAETRLIRHNRGTESSPTKKKDHGVGMGSKENHL